MRERFELWFLNKYPGMSLDGPTGIEAFEIYQKGWLDCSITCLTAVIAVVPAIEVAA